MIVYYVKREQAGDGALYQAYSDADNLPVCYPTTYEAAVRVACELGRIEADRAWEAATPYQRELMSHTGGT